MIIKKLNSLFHKHARVLFGVFAVIIIIAFMDFLTPGRGGCSSSGPESIKIGTAFGENVTYGDLGKISRDLSVAASLTGNQMRNMEPRQLFELYCVLKRAEQLGVRVTENEVAEALKSSPALMKDGKFDIELYRKMLKDMAMTDNDVVAALRSMLTMNKLYSTLSSDIKVNDGEVEMFYRSNFPRFAVRVLTVDAKDFDKNVKNGSDEVLKKFMAANIKDYMIPGTLEALAVEVPASAYKAQADKKITAAEIKKFVDSNRGKMNGSDGKPMNDKELAETYKNAMSNQYASEFVQRKISAFAAAVYRALEKAETPEARLAAFRKTAAAEKLAIITTGKINSDGSSAGKIYSPDLMRELRSMQLGGSMPVTRPVRSGDGYALAYLLNRTPSREMTFAEAKTALQRDYRRSEALKLARAKAAEYSANLNKLAAGSARSVAFSKLPGKITNLSFTPDSMPEDQKVLPMIYTIMPSLQFAKSGDISKAIECSDGAYVVEVSKRAPAEMDKFPSKREALRQQIINAKAQQTWFEFTRSIDSQCSYELQDR